MVKLSLPDLASGVLTFYPSLNTIGPGTLQDQFLQTKEGSQSQVFVAASPHISFKLSETWDLQGIMLGGILWFAHGVLASVSIFVVSSGQSWSDWSEQAAQKERRRLEQLLTTTYGATRAFAWGTVHASYDPRSGSSSIVVRYA